ncbi:Arylsulfatase [Roseimaritima multifibrata]|uniref:Arylsulfatase n=2 Tax=Roseimaritima multifibrata TaxID=1930274 RepID=A0A517MGM6_9BACT|nr:Arylsulfatase [Roseimaritima multifibrata]
MPKLFLLLIVLCGSTPAIAEDSRPNILFYFVDDWGRFANVYASPETPSLNDLLETPNFDRIAREGVRFNNAFVPVSSCGPCRASLVTGQYFWNCGSGAFLNGRASDWKTTPNPFRSMTYFPDLLRESGYMARRAIKTIHFTASKPTKAERSLPQQPYRRYGLYVSEAKTEAETQQRIEETLNHPRYEMRRVLRSSAALDQPFFFVYGTINVHRPFAPDSGEKQWGIDPDSLKGLIPRFLPDVHDVRRDFADYLGEVQAADAMFGTMLDELDAAGQLDNTLIIITGDNGIPGVPRGKTNCYDLSVQAPLMVRWPGKVKAGRTVDDFVNVMDIGPTLLEASDLEIPKSMDGKSFLRQLLAEESGWINPQRNQVVIGRELHFHSARDGNLPYPMRAIRTPEYLYIRNFKTNRWPNGAPYNIEDIDSAGNYDRLAESPYRDLDASLTKAWLLANRDTQQASQSLEQTLGKRPGEELYRVTDDPDQLDNLADQAEYAEVKSELASRLMTVLRDSKDPRLNDDFDRPPYVIPPPVTAKQ